MSWSYAGYLLETFVLNEIFRRHVFLIMAVEERLPVTNSWIFLEIRRQDHSELFTTASITYYVMHCTRPVETHQEFIMCNACDLCSCKFRCCIRSPSYSVQSLRVVFYVWEWVRHVVAEYLSEGWRCSLIWMRVLVSQSQYFAQTSCTVQGIIYSKIYL